MYKYKSCLNKFYNLILVLKLYILRYVFGPYIIDKNERKLNNYLQNLKY